MPKLNRLEKVHSVVKNKSGELLETPESHANHSETGNGDCEGFKNCMDWTTSSQAYQACVSIIGGKVQRLAAEDARDDNAATSARGESQDIVRTYVKA